jgi:cysteinyl-tRNA synthetase
LLQDDPEAFLQRPTEGTALDSKAIEALIDERTAARGAKDFGRADAIRDALAAKGIALEDRGGETTWRRES